MEENPQADMVVDERSCRDQTNHWASQNEHCMERNELCRLISDKVSADAMDYGKFLAFFPSPCLKLA
jgi:hypothetical protein